MGILTNDEFFQTLAALFDARKSKSYGSIFLTQKRLSYNPVAPPLSSDPQVPLSPADIEAELHTPHPLLVRATDGKGKHARDSKLKLSTVVQADALGRFFERYAKVCKAGMTTLKPRDRSKRKAGRAKRRKGGVTAVAVAVA